MALTQDQQTALEEKTLEVARRLIGTKEKTGNNDGTFVEMLQKWIEGDGQTWMKGQPWCDAFNSFARFEAADELQLPIVLPKSASSSDTYASAKGLGLLQSAPPTSGIWVALEKAPAGSGKTHCHTCLAYAFSADTFSSVDGNWSNSVCVPNTPHAIADYDFVKIG